MTRRWSAIGEIAGFGIGHARIIGYRSRNSLGRVSETGPTWGFVSSNQWQTSVGSRAADASLESLRDRCDTRVVVLPAVSTQSRYPAAQDLESVLRLSAVVGSRHGIDLFVCVLGGRVTTFIPMNVFLHNTRDLQARVRERMD